MIAISGIILKHIVTDPAIAIVIIEFAYCFTKDLILPPILEIYKKYARYYALNIIEKAIFLVYKYACTEENNFVKQSDVNKDFKSWSTPDSLLNNLSKLCCGIGGDDNFHGVIKEIDTHEWKRVALSNKSSKKFEVGEHMIFNFFLFKQTNGGFAFRSPRKTFEQVKKYTTDIDNGFRQATKSLCTKKMIRKYPRGFYNLEVMF